VLVGVTSRVRKGREKRESASVGTRNVTGLEERREIRGHGDIRISGYLKICKEKSHEGGTGPGDREYG